MKTVKINTPYIKLEQFLKFESICQSGGEAKFFISDGNVKVNGEEETRRGRKLREGDIIVINKKEYQILQDGDFDADKTTSP